MMANLSNLRPDLQISFYQRFKILRETLLEEALSLTVREFDVQSIDIELSIHVDQDYLSRLAQYGLRGERFFSIPYLLGARPSLLGYYRLLYGLSQKDFYRGVGSGGLKRMEEQNEIMPSIALTIPDVCQLLVGIGQNLMDEMDDFSLQIVRDLQILTMGAQLRGGQNTVVGRKATTDVFRLIHSLVEPYVVNHTANQIEIRNESGRTVVVSFSSDPDIAMTEELQTGVRPLVAVEIKGGTDVSNIHN